MKTVVKKLAESSVQQVAIPLVFVLKQLNVALWINQRKNPPVTAVITVNGNS
jgi:hypothetical protein